MSQFLPSRSDTRSVASKCGAAAVLLFSVAGLTACASVSDVTRQRVADSSSAVQQAQQTIGTSEHGAVELQRAKQNLEAAQNALARDDEKTAQRQALQANLHAELAIAKTQSAHARRGAEEVLESTRTLRQESERNEPTTR